MEEVPLAWTTQMNFGSHGATSSYTQTPYVLRHSRARVRRHLLHANRMSCPTRVGGAEYGEYEFPYHHLYVYGDYGVMEEEEDRHLKPITVGVCAMKNKIEAPPMQNILDRIKARPFIRIVPFAESIILDSPIEDWPVCDCLIAFYSKGFPLEKAIQYVELRKPLVFNDLRMQYFLMDRRQVYKILNANGVETPEYGVVIRTAEDTEGIIVLNEADDSLEINGKVFHKPFVEKPVSAEDHNIYIYFPADFGGGSQRLFRKVKNRSSRYSNESSIRTQGSYIYEEFLATDGTDVKVYTVGPDYAHAEARKSPALDGKVERDENGKEVRFPVILTAKEKLIARAVCMAFKQTVCGFDLLRANGKSYVCDVNGFSFVKNSQKYYEDCAQILLEMITINLCPHYFPTIPPSVDYLMEEFPDMPVPIPKMGKNLELRCVVGVIRHGDRTPKQKMKMIVKHKRFFDLFKELNGYETGQVKIKKPKLLQRVLDISRVLLGGCDGDTGCEIVEKKHKLEQLRSVLEMYGSFSGINRKLQFKLLNKKDENEAPRLLLILKWGGEQTQSGQSQAEELGRAFRIIYPGGEGEYAALPGSGFLRLHSTYRHDLKVYASDEGRVQVTAASFTKGLLDLEGNPTSVLVHLVKRDQAATNMLDTSTVAQNAMNRVKERLHDLMRSPEDFDDTSFSKLAPEGSEQIRGVMQEVRNPRDQCERVYTLIQALMKQLRTMFEQNGDCDLYHGETLQLMVNRWSKLEKDFKQAEGRFDISKIPDIYDCIKYDLLHNRNLNLVVGKDLLKHVMRLADIVMPQEYGITKEEKLDIAHKICKPILTKIQADFHHTIVNETTDVLHRLDHRLSKGVISPKRHVRTRLYFTSESHVHSLTNLLKHDKLIKPSDEEEGMQNLRSVPELNYMTQIVFLLFEDCSKPEDSDLRYRVMVHFSPGVRCRSELLMNQMEATDSPSVSNSPSSSPSKPAPIHTMSSGESKNGVANLVSGSSEDSNELRPKEVHIVRRYSEHAYALTSGSRHKNSLPSSLNLWTGQSRKLSSKKVSIPASFPPLTWTSTENMGNSNESVKSHSESEVTGMDKKRRSPILNRPPLIYYSNSTGILESTVHTPTDSRGIVASGNQDVSELTMAGKDEVKENRLPVAGQDVHFTVGGDEECEDENSQPSQLSTGWPGNTDNMRTRNPTRNSVGAMSGLVLATDLVSSIYQLTPVASVPLSRMNDYLSSVTGVTLKYDLPLQKDSPDQYRRHSYRSMMTDSSGTASPRHLSISNVNSPQTDLCNKRTSKSPLRDSMEAMEQVSQLTLSKSNSNMDLQSDSTLKTSHH